MRDSLPSVLVISMACVSSGLAQERLREPFDAASGWTLSASEDSKADAILDAPAEGTQGHSLRIDYAMSLGGGHFTVAVPLPAPVAGEFEIAFTTKGDAAPMNFECLVGGPDDRVAAVRPGYAAPTSWTRTTLGSRRFVVRGSGAAGRIGRGSFAPTSASRTVELAFSPLPGRKGSLWIDDLTLVSLPPSGTVKPVGTASSQMCELHTPSNLFDGDPKTAWECAPNETAPWYRIDFDAPRSIGGFAIAWEADYAPASVKVLLSDDGASWREAWNATGPLDPERLFIALPDARAKHVRFELPRREKVSAVGIQTLDVLEPAAGDDPSIMLRTVAAAYPRGAFPRSFSGERLAWTVVGVPGDTEEILVSEDGQVELASRRFLIEPFVTLMGHDGPRRISWNESTVTRSLTDAAIPIPVVTRRADPLTLKITSLVDGQASDSAAILCYELTNTSAAPVRGSLRLALRPLQVTPSSRPGQLPGLAGDIHTLSVEGSDILVNDTYRVTFRTPASRVDLLSFAAAPCAPLSAAASAVTSLQDTSGLASAVSEFDCTLDAGQSRRWWVTMPLRSKTQPERLQLGARNPDEVLKVSSLRMAQGWAALLAKAKFQVPAEAMPMVESWYATTAQMLINADGATIQAGSRTLERSSMREAYPICEALIAAGFADLVKSYLNWYVNNQFAYGKIPSSIDPRARDPLDASDAEGQYISLVADCFAHTRDEKFLKAHFKRVNEAVQYIEHMRALGSGPEARAKNEVFVKSSRVPIEAFTGLVPPSAWNGDHATYAYADDWYAIHGLKASVEVAVGMRNYVVADIWAKNLDRCADDLKASLTRTMTAHGISHIPGSVERGEFDAVSAALAIWPAQAEAIIPPEAITATFDRAWQELSARMTGKVEASPITADHVRLANAFVRLGRREHAIDILTWFVGRQRPIGWRQWSSTLLPSDRDPTFVGDDANSAAAAEFVNAFRALFAWERESDNALVLFGGIPEAWIRDKGVAIQDLPTAYGKISGSIVRASTAFTIELSGQVTMPQGGIAVTCPSERTLKSVSVNDQPAQVTPHGEVIVRELPARVVFKTY